MVPASGAYIVSWNFSDKDTGVLVVGRQIKAGDVEIVNAFQGANALAMYEMLSTVYKEGE